MDELLLKEDDEEESFSNSLDLATVDMMVVVGVLNLIDDAPIKRKGIPVATS